MNQSPTPASTADLAETLTAPSATAAPTTAATSTPRNASAPTYGVRYWEQIDPASRSLYPLD